MSTISIIIPAYNVESYIDDCIQSVLKQTVLPSEIIIINDGSIDNTIGALERYKSNKLIKIINTQNNGLGEARNRGLLEATSEYIYFFDSDDILHAGFIEEIQKNIRLYNTPDIIFFSGKSFNDEKLKDNNSFFPSYYRGFKAYFTHSYNLINNLMDHKCFFSSACLYISKRSLWMNMGIRFKPIIHEDEDLIFQISAHAQNSLVLNEVYFYRRIRDDSIMTTNRSKKNLEGFLISLESMYSFKKEYPNIYKELKPVWERRVASLTFTSLNLMRLLKIIIPKTVIIKALYDSYSLNRLVKVTKLTKSKMTNSLKLFK